MTPIAIYKSALQPLLHPQADDPPALAALITWYQASGREAFINAFEGETQLRLRGVNRTDGALIEQGYPKNINEYEGKTTWDNYYIANALIALKEINRLTSAFASPPADAPGIFFQNGNALAKRLFLDKLVLIEDWATFKQQLPGFMGVGKNRLEHAVAIYHSASQIIYGNCSPLSFSDNHSDTSINQLRMAIEIRLRRGFGIVAKEDLNGALVPLALSEVIAAINLHRSNITFGVPFQHVERLYGWANIYMHAGLKQYAWSPIYALHYLRPFILAPAGTYNMNAGIRAKRGVVKQVQATVQGGIDKTRNKLIVDDPEDCDLKIDA